ncbi:MAG: hypothetical protein M3619_24890 [Myxococcota bacterium]|nr:hypothetical protein [Myxococcota bacterium]
MLRTRLGPVASTRIEDALYEVPGVALCVASGDPDPDDAAIDVPAAAIQLAPDTALDLDAVSVAVARLPEYARPRRLRVVAAIPLTDGFRPIKRAIGELPALASYAWDARARRYVPSDVVSRAG